MSLKNIWRWKIARNAVIRFITVRRNLDKRGVWLGSPGNTGTVNAAIDIGCLQMIIHACVRERLSMPEAMFIRTPIIRGKLIVSNHIIPPRLNEVEDKDRRFYVVAPSSVYLQLQNESIQRGTDVWTLGGAVLTAWLRAGCPGDFLGSASVPAPSSSPIADEEGGAD
ncbi:hypothetical protein KQ940_13240 [Marinobacterium sp. D7]|uniref:hypothetical protein n=1 Tax=Marinobacterium ramblicola TaxID=2849041 RepID=UPI001C2DBF76|nr:hypothetical protein [Marinobacterium ramblicola]MBV1789016.1 hypothetical protein [Marinobacterium ramblicola]